MNRCKTSALVSRRAGRQPGQDVRLSVQHPFAVRLTVRRQLVFGQGSPSGQAIKDNQQCEAVQAQREKWGKHMSMNSKRGMFAGLVIAMAIMAVSSGAATTHYWINMLGGTFFNGANWNTGLAPVANDITYFTNNMTCQVDIAGNVQLGGVNYNTTGGTITNNITGLLNAGVTTIYIGGTAGTTARVVQVGSGYMNANSIYVGYTGNGDLMVVGPLGSSGKNMSAPSTFVVGNDSPANIFTLTNGALLSSGISVVGYNAGASGNVAIVTGAGTVWTNTGSFYLGYSGPGAQVRIEDGAALYAAPAVGWLAGCSNCLLLVTGSNSMVRVPAGTASYIGYNTGAHSALSNKIVVADGALFDMLGSDMYVGASSSNCVLQVTGDGSVFANPSGTNKLSNWYNALMVVENGGLARVKCIHNNNYNANNRLQIMTRGTVETEMLLVNQASNSVTNNGGVFQFTTSTPLITKSGSNIVLTNGWISFRAVTGVDVKGNWSGTALTNIAFQGTNSFRLTAATNAAAGQDYVFDQGRGATNYVGLELLNGAGWRGGSVTLGSGGWLLASGTTSSVDGTLINNGTLTVAKSTLSCSQAVTLNGTLKMDLDQWAAGGGLVAGAGLTIGASSVLELTGSYSSTTPRELIRYSGTRDGMFGSVIGLPSGYAIIYDVSGKVLLGRARGTSLIIM